jgi:decaprenyl-phosphate phosphoribosyltransferase
VTSPSRQAWLPATARRAPAGGVAPLLWLAAVIQTLRPRQWPKNLLVFAAPLAGASLGRDDGLGYSLVAGALFIAASSAVYLVNDVADADRDRRHPVKRLRPVASERLPRSHALALAGLCAAAGIGGGLAIGEPRLSAVIGTYLALSMFYSLAGKHIPVLELGLVASGFVLRAIGGAIATHVPPSGWFLVVCSLGALMVAIAKRYAELTMLDTRAAAHRPVMSWYRAPLLRLGERIAAGAMILAYVLWARGGSNPWMAGWHLASVLPLAAALARFDHLTGQATGRPTEDLITKDGVMIFCELAWLAMFAAGL